MPQAAIEPPTNRAAPTWYAFAAAKEEGEYEIRIYEEIGQWGITAKQFADDLERIDAARLYVRLNTPGGDAFDGITIYNSLRAHPAEIVICVDGLAASAGSIIAMAGDEIRMADNAFLMIHNAWGGVMGEADDMRGYAAMLDKLDDAIAGTYQVHAGKTRKYWRDKMDAETWFSAAEAKAEGLCDTIEKPEKAAANRFDFKVFNHAPDAARKLWALQNPETKAPEVSPRGEPSPVISQETPKMADTPTTQAAPATDPAPVINSVTAVASSASDAHRAEMERIKGMTAEATYENGRATGYDQGLAEGDRRTIARFEQTLAACPGDPQMAVKAFLSKQPPDAVKLAFETASEVRAKSEERERELALKNARLEQLVAIGGHPGVNLGFVNDVNPETGPLDTPRATAQAEREWDTQPAVRRTARTKDIYVAARAAELDGSHRSFAR